MRLFDEARKAGISIAPGPSFSPVGDVLKLHPSKLRVSLEHKDRTRHGGARGSFRGWLNRATRRVAKPCLLLA